MNDGTNVLRSDLHAFIVEMDNVGRLFVKVRSSRKSNNAVISDPFEVHCDAPIQCSQSKHGGVIYPIGQFRGFENRVSAWGGVVCRPEELVTRLFR